MRKIIGLCGLIGSGKGTVSDILKEEGYIELSFASVLKDVLSIVFDWDRVMLEGKTPESRAWREQVDHWWEDHLGIDGFSPRYAMQHVGTNLFRKHFHTDIWCLALERQLVRTTGNIVISDARFYNEIDVIKRNDGIMVDVWRKEVPEWWDNAIATNHATQEEEYVLYDDGHHMEVAYPNVHPSEYSWAGCEFDITIQNKGSLEYLRQSVKNKLLAP